MQTKNLNANYLDLSAQQRQQLIQDDPSLQEWLSPSYEFDARSSKIVVGTTRSSVSFPQGAPEYIYAALFDSNACFDALRRFFLSIGDHASMLNSASMLLELHHRHQMDDSSIMEFATKL